MIYICINSSFSGAATHTYFRPPSIIQFLSDGTNQSIMKFSEVCEALWGGGTAFLLFRQCLEEQCPCTKCSMPEGWTSCSAGPGKNSTWAIDWLVKVSNFRMNWTYQSMPKLHKAWGTQAPNRVRCKQWAQTLGSLEHILFVILTFACMSTMLASKKASSFYQMILVKQSLTTLWFITKLCNHGVDLWKLGSLKY